MPTLVCVSWISKNKRRVPPTNLTRGARHFKCTEKSNRTQTSLNTFSEILLSTASKGKSTKGELIVTFTQLWVKPTVVDQKFSSGFCLWALFYVSLLFSSGSFFGKMLWKVCIHVSLLEQFFYGVFTYLALECTYFSHCLVQKYESALVFVDKMFPDICWVITCTESFLYTLSFGSHSRPDITLLEAIVWCCLRSWHHLCLFFISKAMTMYTHWSHFEGSAEQTARDCMELNFTKGAMNQNNRIREETGHDRQPKNSLSLLHFTALPTSILP